MRTSIVSFGLGSTTGSALSCFNLAWFLSLLMCILVSFSDGLQVLVFLAVGHRAPTGRETVSNSPHLCMRFLNFVLYPVRRPFAVRSA